MGALLCDCFKKKPNPNENSVSSDTFEDVYRKISNVAPQEILDKSQASSVQPIEKFYYIPKEEAIDKFIEHLDEATILSDQEILTLNEILAELYGLKRKYNFPDISKPVLSSITSQPNQRQSDLNQTFTMILEDHEKGVDFKRSQTFGISKSPFQDALKRKATGLMVGVYNAKFMHEEIIQKHGLQKPYVVVKIYLKQTATGKPMRRDKSSPDAKAEVKSFMTRKCEDVVKPDWDELFEYPISVKEEEKDAKFGLYSVGVSLFYTRGNSAEVWQVGEEQHFSLSSLKDQKMQVKVVDYKDGMLKGVLARLGVKLQLVHNMDQLRERLCQDIDVRIEKLAKIKEKHLPNGHRMSDASLLNTANNQSIPSVYSMTGLKENEYFFS